MHIAAAPEVVWDLVTDLARTPEWNRETLQTVWVPPAHRALGRGGLPCHQPDRGLAVGRGVPRHPGRPAGGLRVDRVAARAPIDALVVPAAGHRHRHRPAPRLPARPSRLGPAGHGRAGSGRRRGDHRAANRDARGQHGPHARAHPRAGRALTYCRRRGTAARRTRCGARRAHPRRPAARGGGRAAHGRHRRHLRAAAERGGRARRGAPGRRLVAAARSGGGHRHLVRAGRPAPPLADGPGRGGGALRGGSIAFGAMADSVVTVAVGALSAAGLAAVFPRLHGAAERLLDRPTQVGMDSTVGMVGEVLTWKGRQGPCSSRDRAGTPRRPHRSTRATRSRSPPSPA